MPNSDRPFRHGAERIRRVADTCERSWAGLTRTRRGGVEQTWKEVTFTKLLLGGFDLIISITTMAHAH